MSELDELARQATAPKPPPLPGAAQREKAAGATKMRVKRRPKRLARSMAPVGVILAVIFGSAAYRYVGRHRRRPANPGHPSDRSPQAARSRSVRGLIANGMVAKVGAGAEGRPYVLVSRQWLESEYDPLWPTLRIVYHHHADQYPSFGQHAGDVLEVRHGRSLVGTFSPRLGFRRNPSFRGPAPDGR